MYAEPAEFSLARKGTAFMQLRRGTGFIVGIACWIIAARGAAMAETRVPVVEGLPSDRVYCLASAENRLWVGTEHGLAEIENGRVTRVLTVADGLAGDVVTSLTWDPVTDVLWIGTYGGVSEYSAGKVQSYTALDSGLASDLVFSMATRNGQVWAATAAGLSRLDTRTGNWTTYDSRHTPSIDVWPNVMGWSAGSLVAGSWGGGLFTLDASRAQWTGELAGAYVIDVAADDATQSLWAATQTGLFRRRQGAWVRVEGAGPGAIPDRIRRIRTHEGRLWAGGEHGLWGLDANGKPDRNTGLENAVRGMDVRDVLFRGDEIWLATEHGLWMGVLTKLGNALRGEGWSRVYRARKTLRLSTDAGRAYKRIGAETDRAIALGLFAPMENSRDAARGLSIARGARMAVEEANLRNEQGHRGTQRSFALKIHNDAQPWGMAAMEPVRMAEGEHVVGVLASSDWVSTQALTRVAAQLEFPVLNAASSDPAAEESGSPWMIQLTADDRRLSRLLLAGMLRNQNVRKIGILREDTRYAQAGSEAFRKELARVSAATVEEAVFPSGAKSFTAQIGQLRGAGVQEILLWCSAREAAEILRQMRAAGMSLPVFGSKELMSPQLISIGGAATEGLVTVGALDGDARKTFDSHFRQRWNAPADIDAAQAYDATRLLIAMIEKHGTEPHALRSGLETCARQREVCAAELGIAWAQSAEWALFRVTNGAWIPAR